ncbi:hypothetical protein [Zooshikella ganghwensis]|uniref:Uncharacterized protein n=1 Tax=Zooshikella ganghwensis TaxID=202772 RepID=A0A4P9VFN1_9GAMM|nr:hypothetical protein [Zooshikella ganghwensis]RDH41918.1 hypothetical protein B9G39_26250 [Zooshikella ganghwensis]
MKEYYPILCKHGAKTLYLIYVSTSVDYILSKHSNHIAFTSFEKCKMFIVDNKLLPFHEDELGVFNFDVIDKFIKNNGKTDFSREVLDCWDLFDDIGENNTKYWADYWKKSEELRDLHEKLFFEIDVFNSGDIVKSCWDSSDLLLVKDLLEFGLMLFNQHLHIEE